MVTPNQDNLLPNRPASPTFAELGITFNDRDQAVLSAGQSSILLSGEKQYDDTLKERHALRADAVPQYRQNRATIYGLKRRTFYVIVVITFVVIMGAVVGGAVGGTRKSKPRQSTNSISSTSTPASSTGASKPQILHIPPATTSIVTTATLTTSTYFTTTSTTSSSTSSTTATQTRLLPTSTVEIASTGISTTLLHSRSIEFVVTQTSISKTISSVTSGVSSPLITSIATLSTVTVRPSGADGASPISSANSLSLSTSLGTMHPAIAPSIF
ncbi:hypothetical protein V1512DRAFT_248051 [Lipomyces arxii]|uniref:uncharacterized protein n=1 Tax=Lipomyces arxii TaxID=56418 RepID=UPI0034CD6957